MITQTATRTVYENRWMRVREDEIRYASGDTGIYGVVEKTDFVIIAPRHTDGRFEMVEQFRYPVGGRFWEFPQGAWETRPDVPLPRVAHGELEEETGLKAEDMKEIGHLHQASGYSTQTYRAYLATGLSDGQINRDAEEQDMITGRFSLEEIKTMIREGRIMDQTTVSVIGLMYLGGHL